jgi:hypothetical protein
MKSNSPALNGLENNILVELRILVEQQRQLQVNGGIKKIVTTFGAKKKPRKIQFQTK